MARFLLIFLAAAAVLATALLLLRFGPDDTPPPARESERERPVEEVPGPTRVSGRTVSGAVLCAGDGRPVAGARVRFRWEGGDAAAGSDARGGYRVPLPAGLGTVERRATAEGYVSKGRFRKATVTPEGRLPPVYLDRIAARVPARLVTFDRKPVPGVSVWIDRRERPVVSDAEGRLGPVPVGETAEELEWTAWAPTCLIVSRELIPLEPGNPPEEIPLVLPAIDFVEGVVVDRSDRPVVGVEVLQRVQGVKYPLKTGADGRFRWPLPVGARAELRVEDESWRGLAWCYAGCPVRLVVRPAPARRPSPSREPALPKADPPSKPDLAATARVRLVLHDAEGEPAPGAIVQARLPGARSFAREVTDLDGGCSLAVPGGRRVELLVSRPPNGYVLLDFLVEVGGTHDLGDVSLHRPRPDEDDFDEEEVVDPATVIRGRVLDAAGRPFPRVDILTKDGELATVEPDGTFRLECERPGEQLRLLVQALGAPPVAVEAMAGGEEVVVRLPARGAICVSLKKGVRENRYALRFEVRVAGETGHEFLGIPDLEFYVDDGSSVRIACPGGTYDLSFCADPGEWFLFRNVVVRAGGETVLEYDFPLLGVISGTVSTPDGDTLNRAEIRMAFSDELMASVGDAEEGRFWLWGSDALRPVGVFRLRVYAEGFAPALTEPLDLRTDLSLDIRLTRGGVVRGRLVDTDGEPLKGTVHWLPEFGPPLNPAETDGDGRFELYGRLPCGTARLEAVVEGHEPVTATSVVTEDVPANVTIRIR